MNTKNHDHAIFVWTLLPDWRKKERGESLKKSLYAILKVDPPKFLKYRTASQNSQPQDLVCICGKIELLR